MHRPLQSQRDDPRYETLHTRTMQCTKTAYAEDPQSMGLEVDHQARLSSLVTVQAEYTAAPQYLGCDIPGEGQYFKVMNFVLLTAIFVGVRIEYWQSKATHWRVNRSFGSMISSICAYAAR